MIQPNILLLHKPLGEAWGFCTITAPLPTKEISYPGNNGCFEGWTIWHCTPQRFLSSLGFNSFPTWIWQLYALHLPLVANGDLTTLLLLNYLCIL